MYNEKQIRQLLTRFMEGHTTVEEEQEIARWFAARSEVAPDLEDYRQMFAYFDAGMPEEDVATHSRGSGQVVVCGPEHRPQGGNDCRRLCGCGCGHDARSQPVVAVGRQHADSSRSRRHGLGCRSPCTLSPQGRQCEEREAQGTPLS